MDRAKHFHSASFDAAQGVQSILNDSDSLECYHAFGGLLVSLSYRYLWIA